MTAPRQPADPSSARLGRDQCPSTKGTKGSGPFSGATVVFKRHLIDALVVAVLTSLVGIGWLAYHNMRSVIESEQWTTHTRVVIQELGDLLSNLEDAETGQRGFIITGKAEYLEPYHAGLAAAPAHLAELRRLSADNPRQQQRLDAIAPLIAARFATLKETIALRETQGFPTASAALMAKPGKTLMDQIRVLVAQAQAEEAQLLKYRNARTVSDTHKTLQSVMLGGSLGALALLLLFIRLRWESASRQRAQTSLRVSEQRLRMAIDAAELGIWSWQPDGARIVWEDELPITGMARTDAPLNAARFAVELVHPEDLAAFEQAIADTVHTGARLYFQGRIQRPDGALRWVEFTGRSEPGPDGTSLRVTGVAQDITERVLANEELRQRTAQLEVLLDEAPLGVYLLDADLHICQANPIARQAFGNRPDLIGCNLDAAVHLIWPAAVADEHAALFRHTLESGESYFSPDFFAQRFGREVTEHYDWQINRIPLPDGRQGVVCYFKDISERVVAQQEIRDSEERFRSILHQSPAGIVQTDATGCLTLMNDRWCQMLGYPEAEMVGRSVLEFTHTSSVEATATAFGALAAGGPDFQIDKHYSRKDGTLLPAQSNVSAIRSPSGDFLGIIAVVMDMSERLRFEDTLRQSEERFRAFVTASSDAAYRMSPDWREMRQLHGQNFIADTPAPNANWLQEYIHPDDQPRVLAAIDQAIQSKSLFELEHQVVTVDGSLGWTLSRAVPMLDANGDIVEWFGTASDVTEQRRAARALYDSELRYRNLFNSIDQGFCIIELLFDEDEKPVDYHFLDVNPAFARQSGLIDATGKRLRELIPEPEAHWFEVYGNVALTGEAIRFINQVKSTMGDRWFEVYAFPLGWPQSRRIALLFNNITERKAVEKSLQQAKVQAEQANNAKSRFLAATSHDLRQPLTALSIYAKVLTNHVAPAGLPMLANLNDCVASLSELLTDLLDLSKLDAGVVTHKRSDFALADVVASLLSIHAPEAQLKGLRLRQVPSRQTGHSDPVLFARILGNLIDNAIRYTESGGVVVACRRRRGKTWVEVRDSGIGIAADQTTEIFEEFTQLGDGARNRGSGLGLAIVAKTAALLGLEITVRSRLGRGSVFALELPLGQAMPMPAQAPRPVVRRPLRIALVEDNAMVAEALVRALQGAGHQVVAAATGEALLAELGSLAPDIVISDYRLAHGETGFDVISSVRAAMGMELPAILISGDTAPGLLRSMADRGIVLLHKPLDLDMLQTTLQDLTCHSEDQACQLD